MDRIMLGMIIILAVTTAAFIDDPTWHNVAKGTSFLMLILAVVRLI
jgi:hypothetical protein